MTVPIRSVVLTVGLILALLLLCAGCIYTSTTMYVKDPITGQDKEIFHVRQCVPGKCSYTVEENGKKTVYEVDTKDADSLPIRAVKAATNIITP